MIPTIRTKQLIPTLTFSIVLGLGLSCADGADPDIAERDDLSPPLNLTTVTGSESIELRWNAQNFEDELQGYHVYMIEGKSIANIAADSANLPQYPQDSYNQEATLREASIPRCEDNNSFFGLFGITANTSESCGGGLFVTQATEDTDDGEGTPITAKQVCYDPAAPDTNLGNENISVAKDASSEFKDGEGIQRCLIKGLTNGTDYTFLVVAVLGSDFDEISWSSNLADDTPAPVLLSQDVAYVTSQYQAITLDPVNFTATLGTSTPCPASSLCDVTKANSLTDVPYNIYVARDDGALFPQRLLVSTAATSRIKLLGRGPMTTDPLQAAGTISTRIPGDQAVADGDSYYDSGTVVAVYENSVFDFQITDTNGVARFGKIILHGFSYASTSTDANVTVKTEVVMQTAANNVNYLTEL
ncbi:MAG: hypothetical protein HRU19_15720 [Pseudobacteriovorax sp.]|nr:hypothetical protein [Pseudobacteriovorax sp.]